MLYLIVILIISYIAALFSRHHPIRVNGGLGKKLPHPIGFIVPAVLFTTFSGLRNNLGDTFYNIHSFQLLAKDMPMPRLGEKEILYRYLQYFLRHISDNPQNLIFICAIFSCIPVIYILYKYSDSYELSIFLYVGTSFYTFSFNGMRQYMAAGIILMGTKYLFSQEKKAWFKFSIFVIIAAMIHSSAIIMIPIYFIVRRKSWSVTTIAIIFVSILVTLLFDSFLPQFLNMISQSDFSIYEQTGWFTNGAESGSSLIRVIVMLLPLIIAYLSKERLKQLGKTGDILVNLAVVNFCFYMISLYNWIFARLAIYTGCYFIVLLSWLITNSFKRKDKKIVYFACIVLYCLYFWNVRYSIIGYESNYF